MSNKLYPKILFVLMLALLSSCGLTFRPTPNSDAHEAFRNINSVNKVTPSGLSLWLERSETSDPFRKVPYILVHEFRVNSSQSDREKIARDYIYIYKNLSSGKYGEKQKSIIYPNGKEVVFDEAVDVKEYANMYIYILERNLALSQSGEFPLKGESQISDILVILNK